MGRRVCAKLGLGVHFVDPMVGRFRPLRQFYPIFRICVVPDPSMQRIIPQSAMPVMLYRKKNIRESIKMVLDFEDEVRRIIAKFPLVIFSKSHCLHCATTKRELETHTVQEDIHVNIYVVELDEHPDGEAMQRALRRMSNLRTVPSVYVTGEHIGGGEQTRQAISNGTIRDRLMGR